MMRDYGEVTRFLGLCCLTVLFRSGPAMAGPQFAGGTGEPNDPYQIATPEQLTAIGSDPNLLEKHFVLVADIDLDPNLPGGRTFTRAVIARDKNDTSDLFEGTPFTGRFDGRRHKIRNLTIHADSPQFAGLFGSVGRGGRVYDVRVENASVSGEEDSRCLGVLAGYI